MTKQYDKYIENKKNIKDAWDKIKKEDKRINCCNQNHRPVIKAFECCAECGKQINEIK